MFLWNCPGLQLAKPPLWQLSQLLITTPVREAYGMWLATGPSAGGNDPLWQVEHLLATGAWLSFQAYCFQPTTPWQLAQLATVGMWLLALPVAELPLWQLAQLVAAVNVL